jgi:hypothetical protein
MNKKIFFGVLVLGLAGASLHACRSRVFAFGINKKTREIFECGEDDMRIAELYRRMHDILCKQADRESVNQVDESTSVMPLQDILTPQQLNAFFKFPPEQKLLRSLVPHSTPVQAKIPLFLLDSKQRVLVNVPVVPTKIVGYKHIEKKNKNVY